MKWIVYELVQSVNVGTEENPEIITDSLTKKLPYSDQAMEIARREASNEPQVINDEIPDATDTPNQLDLLEAQVTYTAMMTDTLLEV